MSVQTVGGSANTQRLLQQVQTTLTQGAGKSPEAVLEKLEKLADKLGTVAGNAARNEYLERLKHMDDTGDASKPGPVVDAPFPGDCGHPSGSLKVDDKGVITTPGGYKIEPTSQFEWKITTPEGKTTRVWGDPHVDEGDGGKWDFKRDSTFVLPDGTRINCTTAPWGNSGMTVSKELEIISGNERVKVTDIDKGKGKTGAVTQDGFAHVNSFGGKDVFVMGGDGDDWSFQGKEVVGSNNGGDSFKLGQDLKALVDKPKQFGGPEAWINRMIEDLRKAFDGLGNTQRQGPGANPWANGHGCWGPQTGYDPSRHLEQLTGGFKDMSSMFRLLNSVVSLQNSVQTLRQVWGGTY